jgi:2-haloacid dehalogenase
MDIDGIVFDLYGTLYDPGHVARACEDAFPTNGNALARLWRAKQLEYTWLRSLMARFASFDRVTEDALRFSCAELDLTLDPATLRRLCAAWLRLPPFADVPGGLRRLKDAHFPLAVLSNGSQESLAQLIGNSGMKWGFDHVFSVDAVQVFKPDAKVYLLAEQGLGIAREKLLFVSANAWDASAAKLFGFQVCWINRNGSPFDELGTRPDVELPDLSALSEWVLVQSLK